MKINSKILMQWSSFLLILYVGLPFMNSLPGAFRVALCYMIFGLYFLAVLIERRKFLNTILLILALFVFDCLVYYEQWAPFFDIGFEQKSRALFLFWMPMLQGIYYIRHTDVDFSKMYNFLIGVFGVTSVSTMITLFSDPKASRILAKGGEEIGKADYYLKNVGGYGYIYSIVFLVPLLVYLIKHTKLVKEKFFYGIILLIQVMCVVLSQYTTALLLIIVEIPFLLLKKIKLKHYLLFVGIVFFGLLLTSSMGEWIYALSTFLNNINLEILGNRLKMLYLALSTNDTSGDLAKRYNYYQDSLNAFSDNIFLGNIFSANKRELGMHSEVLDLLGALGLFGVGYFIILMRYVVIRYVKYFKSEYFKELFVFLLCMLFILGTFNTVFIGHEISLVVFLGAIFVYNEKRGKNEASLCDSSCK